MTPKQPYAPIETQLAAALAALCLYLYAVSAAIQLLGN